MFGPAFRGVLDQALTSAENFAIGVILVRNCTKAEFGLYALGYGILILGWSLTAALITAQLPATYARQALNLEERQRQCGALLRMLLIACGVVVAVGYVLAVLCTQLQITDFYSGLYWLMLASVLPGMCLRDFMRRYFFQEGTETRALSMDVAALILTIAALGSAAAIGLPHLNIVATGTLAIGGLAVSIRGVVSSGLSPRKRSIGIRSDFSSPWRGGVWNIGATLVSWVQNQAYTFFATVMLGLSGLATANAPRVLLTPITLLSTGLSLPLMPRFAKRRDNLGALLGARSATILIVLTSLFVGLYILALWLARDLLVHRLLGDRYSNVWSCIVAWAIANVFTNLRTYYTTFLLAKGQFRQLAAANVVSAVAVVCLTAPLIHCFGVVGSIYSFAVGELLLGLATWRECRIAAAKNAN